MSYILNLTVCLSPGGEPEEDGPPIRGAEHERSGPHAGLEGPAHLPARAHGRGKNHGKMAVRGSGTVYAKKDYKF